ncbi:hypothetical protein J6590_056909 [Homalodisca vitripennis]|nr:hypothetical protein J6590_056909 [Homalodisca vitripennis]
MDPLIIGFAYAKPRTVSKAEIQVVQYSTLAQEVRPILHTRHNDTHHDTPTRVKCSKSPLYNCSSVLLSVLDRIAAIVQT